MRKRTDIEEKFAASRDKSGAGVRNAASQAPILQQSVEVSREARFHSVAANVGEVDPWSALRRVTKVNGSARFILATRFLTNCYRRSMLISICPAFAADLRLIIHRWVDRG